MEKELLSKKDLLLYAKNATQSILNSLVAIKFIKAELYIVNKDIYSKLLEIDSLLLPHKKDTRKTNIYSIDTFVCKKRMNLATNNGNTWSDKTVLFGH